MRSGRATGWGWKRASGRDTLPVGVAYSDPVRKGFRAFSGPNGAYYLSPGQRTGSVFQKEDEP
jgi:hypothetical protein